MLMVLLLFAFATQAWTSGGHWKHPQNSRALENPPVALEEEVEMAVDKHLMWGEKSDHILIAENSHDEDKVWFEFFCDEMLVSQ